KPCQPTERFGGLELIQYVSFVPEDGEAESVARARFHEAFKELWTAIRLGHTRFLNRVNRPPRDHLIYLPVPRRVVDREGDVAWLCTCLRQSGKGGVFAVTGQAGIGKTTVAAKAVQELYEEGVFPDGIGVVQCEDKHNDEDAVNILREALGRFSY